MKQTLGLFASAVCVSLFCSGAESGSDTAQQMKSMQAQLTGMALKMEAQQKKIDDQDRIIAALKAVETPLKETGGLNKLDSPEQPKKGDGLKIPYELPGVTVTDAPIPQVPLANKGPDAIGAYNQPLWTTQRRFSETRAYVIPEGDIEFEYWNVIEVPKHKGEATTEEKYEIEMGLGNRLQVDIYALSHSIGNGKYFAFDEHDIELRYAFADWNKIPGNPTAYAEYKFLDKEPDHLELKMLFSGDTKICCKKLDWAANFVYEHQMGGPQQTTYEITGGLGYEFFSKFSVGAEVKAGITDEHGNRGKFGEPELLLGPSFQWCPLKQCHIDFVPLAGMTRNSPELKTLLIIGWKF